MLPVAPAAAPLKTFKHTPSHSPSITQTSSRPPSTTQTSSHLPTTTETTSHSLPTHKRLLIPLPPQKCLFCLCILLATRDDAITQPSKAGASDVLVNMTVKAKAKGQLSYNTRGRTCKQYHTLFTNNQINNANKNNCPHPPSKCNDDLTPARGTWQCNAQDKQACLPSKGQSAAYQRWAVLCPLGEVGCPSAPGTNGLKLCPLGEAVCAVAPGRGGFTLGPKSGVVSAVPLGEGVWAAHPSSRCLSCAP